MFSQLMPCGSCCLLQKLTRLEHKTKIRLELSDQNYVTRVFQIARDLEGEVMIFLLRTDL